MLMSLRVRCPGLDASGLANLTSRLRGQILQLDVDSAERRTADPAPAGAKSDELVSFTELAINLAPVVVPELVRLVTSWLSRQEVDVEVELDGQRFHGTVTRQQRDALVELYLRRVDCEG